VTTPRSPRAVLLYRATCPKCRVLSQLAVLLSLGRINRIPLDSARAAALTERDPALARKLTFIAPGRTTTGWRVVPAVVWWMASGRFVRDVVH
jgi:hypothetical protein